MCAFENGSSGLCRLFKNKGEQKRGNSNKFNIMIKHMRITDLGNEISSDSPMSMVLDHSVSQSSENSHSRTQTGEGGGCVYEHRHVGMMYESWILW